MLGILATVETVDKLDAIKLDATLLLSIFAAFLVCFSMLNVHVFDPCKNKSQDAYKDIYEEYKTDELKIKNHTIFDENPERLNSPEQELNDIKKSSSRIFVGLVLYNCSTILFLLIFIHRLLAANPTSTFVDNLSLTIILFVIATICLLIYLTLEIISQTRKVCRLKKVFNSARKYAKSTPPNEFNVSPQDTYEA